jgi:hypothetical protein
VPGTRNTEMETITTGIGAPELGGKEKKLSSKTTTYCLKIFC